MSDEIAAGLLWFDDDAKRSVQCKIADGVERYRERTGFEPTVCQLNPAQADALAHAQAASSRRRATTVVEPEVKLRLIPTAHIRPHHFLIGVGVDDRVRKAVVSTTPRQAPALASRGRARRKSEMARSA